MTDKTKKQLDETRDQYFYRLCREKDALGLTWAQLRDIFNDELGNNYGESAYRKEWNAFQRIFDANTDKIIGEGSYLEEIKTATDELFKAKKQFYDQRREYNKLLINDSREEHIASKLIEAANTVPLKLYDNDIMFNNVCYSNKEALVCCADWHYGQISDNIWNTYNTDIFIERLNKLFNHIIDIIKTNNVSTLHIALLGDLINGGIHCSSRVASEENVVEQLMDVSEITANFINKLSIYVDSIKVYSTYGNHARTIQDKKDSIHADNMERVIPFWLKQRLQNNSKVEIIDNDYYEFLYFQICGYNIVCTHGDLDGFKKLGLTVNTLFSKKYGKTIDFTFSADKHHLESFEQFDIDSTLVGSMCGSDEYANNRRLYSNPMQTVCVFTPECGKLCTYNIKL